MTIFDTCIWVALFNKKDNFYREAIDIITGIDTGNIVIFDFTYEEVLTVLRNKTNPEKCESFRNFLREMNIEIVFTDQNLFKIADNLFFNVKKLSFVDCLTLVATKINKANFYTFDKELQKAEKSLK